MDNNLSITKEDFSIDDLYAKPDYKLINHLLDVGHIARCLMTEGRAHELARIISETLNISLVKTISSISWLCALHDIGKAHPDFIANMYANSSADLYYSLCNKGIIKESTDPKFRHERYSREIIKKYFKENGYSPSDFYQFADLVAFHHQGKADHNFDNKIESPGPLWEDIHQEIIERVSNEFRFSKDFICDYTVANGVLYSILSIMVTADWIASGNEWKETMSEWSRPCGMSRWVNSSLFLIHNDLDKHPIKEKFNSVKWSDAFDFEPNDLQKLCLNISKESPNLMIIEYPCGGGKTEAALASAINMGKDKTGFYIATPTMSTAKSMALRVRDIVRKLGISIKIPEFDSSALWSNKDMNTISPELWTSRTRHKILYPYAIGTIDQILKTILSYRYSCIGMMGLSDKVLIIDEVHAYDSYMLTELKRLLEWCTFLQVPVILLSATLPTITKNELLKAAGCDTNKLPTDNSYPLVTTYKDGECSCYPISLEGRTFNINIIETDDYDKVWNEELSKDYNGCTAFIEGTVDKTWALYDKANEYIPNTFLFHGQNTLENKEEKTKYLLDTLGKERQNRPDKLSIISTSIIEQSLDIDLDRLITNIAPIDLLIQRFGRVWRHLDKGTIREKETIQTPITIIVPKNRNNLPCRIYDDLILLKTIDVLRGKDTINTVTDARTLIDAVYDSKELILNMGKSISAGNNCIDSPYNAGIIYQDNYGNFSNIKGNTRYESYPTVSIAIVKPDDLINIDNDYEKVRKIMRQNVITVPKYKVDRISIEPLDIKCKSLSNVLIYLKDDLLSQNIELTKDGIRWNSN